MKLYNTLTRKKETFVPVQPGKVKMYVCGPTVYNHIHIGNARPFIVFDVVRRYFEYKGFEVNYVQNYTDVDDKIINKAKEEGITSEEVAEKYIQEVERDAKGLGIHKATHTPKATEEVPHMVDMIQVLLDKAFAYEVDGTVFFATRKFKDYGKLSKKNPDDLEAGSRVAVDEAKINPMDFVLWKPKKEGEPSWPSPWGDGRPGWHLECSVMAKRYLGDTIDIHCGGTDLIFPHHENEIAQSEAANGKQFAKYWLHNGFINVDNRKMSKSLGNFFTVREITEEFPYEVIRFFMLSAHYRSPINFSRDLMEAASNSLQRIQTGAKNLVYLHENSELEKVTDEENSNIELLKSFKEKFEKAMDDDFNTADAVSAIFELIRFANTHVTISSSKIYIQKVLESLRALCDVIGIDLDTEDDILDSDIEALIQKRQEARNNKDFTLSDKIRDDLMKKGISLEDTREGVKFRRV